MVKIKEYQINVVGKQKELDIPSGFRMVVVKQVLGQDEYTAGEFERKSMVCTFKDGTYSEVLINDDFVGDVISVSLGAILPTETPQEAAEADLEPLLNSTYGVGNWAAV